MHFMCLPDCVQMWVSSEEEEIILNFEDKKKPFKLCMHLTYFGNLFHLLHHNVGQVVLGVVCFLRNAHGRKDESKH